VSNGAAFMHAIGPRRDCDFYPTPDDCADVGARMLAELGVSSVLDPCAGTGSLLRASERAIPGVIVRGIELDPARAEIGGFVCCDALSCIWPETDAVIINPPFLWWAPFVERATESQARVVVALGRLGVLASRKRKPMWERIAKFRGVSVRVLSERPSFTGDGKTDGSDYAWFAMVLGERSRWLSWE
jgi:predicted RNA methylase